MKQTLLFSGTSNSLIDWDIEDIISTDNLSADRIRLTEYEMDNTISLCGMTYSEIEQLNLLQLR